PHLFPYTTLFRSCRLPDRWRQKQLPAKTALSTDTFRSSRSPARQRTPGTLIGRLFIPIVIDHRFLPTCLTLLAPFLDALAEHIKMNTLHHPAQLRTGGKPHENRTLHKALQTMAVLSWQFVAVPGGGKVTAQTTLEFRQIAFFIHSGSFPLKVTGCSYYAPPQISSSPFQAARVRLE